MVATLRLRYHTVIIQITMTITILPPTLPIPQIGFLFLCLGAAAGGSVHRGQRLVEAGSRGLAVHFAGMRGAGRPVVWRMQVPASQICMKVLLGAAGIIRCDVKFLMIRLKGHVRIE